MLNLCSEVIKMNEVVTLISTVGFPAAMCCLLMWYIWKMQEQHAHEVSELKKAIDNNTRATTRLVERLGSQ